MAIGMIELIGITGMMLIVVGWIISIPDIPPLKLSLLYMLGSCSLVVYSYLVNDIIFLVLNIGATAVSGYNALRAIQVKHID
ncbi:MAG: hypothetical protein F7B60_02000 [Desulfurococcales archaeon]|nr:hypothetical protein [Desulfurococcales archaeon]